MVDVAVAVERDEVGTDEPVAAGRGRVLLGALPVAEHEPGVGAVHGEQPLLPRRDRGRAAVDREHRDPATGLRATGAAGRTGVDGP